MRVLAATIIDVIEKTFQPEYLDFVFSGRLTLDDVVIQILVECCKYAYDNTAEKHSLNYYLKKDNLTEDYERMTLQRAFNYINEHRSIEHEYYKRNLGLDIMGLKSQKLENIEARLQGHRINDFQYWEINNVHDMQLVKAIVDRKITSKNITQKILETYVTEYDEFCRKAMDDKRIYVSKFIFNWLSIFILEWKYSFDFFYEIADEMEKYNTTEIPDLKRRIIAFCGTVQFNSLLSINNSAPVIYTGESRMVVQRRKYLHDIVTAKGETFDIEIRRYAEGLYLTGAMLTQMTYCKIPIKEWFITNTSQEDWASVFKELNVFQAWIPDKIWTKKKVRYVKEIYDLVSLDYKNPDFRS